MRWISTHLLLLLLIKNFSYLFIFFFQVCLVKSCSFTNGIVFLDFFQSFFPVSHSIFAIVMLHYFLKVLSLVAVNNDVSKFVFGLNTISLVHHLDIHVNLKINIQGLCFISLYFHDVYLRLYGLFRLLLLNFWLRFVELWSCLLKRMIFLKY